MAVIVAHMSMEHNRSGVLGLPGSHCVWFWLRMGDGADLAIVLPPRWGFGDSLGLRAPRAYALGY